METLQLKLSLAGIDTPEDKLRDLQSLLQDAGIKQLVTLMGGQLQVESQLGKGRKFAVILDFFEPEE